MFTYSSIRTPLPRTLHSISTARETHPDLVLDLAEAQVHLAQVVGEEAVVVEDPARVRVDVLDA